MPNVKKVLNFYQIVSQDPDQVPNTDVQKILNGLRNHEFSTWPREGKSLKLPGGLISDGTLMFGALYNVQMSNILPAMDLDTDDLSALPLTANQGLANPTCFLIDPSANILVIESGGGSISANLLCGFLTFNSTLPKVTPSLIINPGQVNKFLQMRAVVKFQVKIAKVSNGEIFAQNVDGRKKTISQVIRSADDTNSDELTYTVDISKENRKEDKSLNKHTITNMVREFLDYKDTEEVSEMKVWGKYEDDRVFPVELIVERLHDEINYETTDRLIRDFQVKKRTDLIKAKYSHHRDSILKAYKL